jgi:pyrrolidone-carboxylate peptidase
VIEHPHFNLEEKVNFFKTKHSLKLEVSAHAGTYVCNSLYFQTMLRYSNIPTLFIHVPQIKELDQQATSEQAELVHSLEIIIRELGRANFDRNS